MMSILPGLVKREIGQRFNVKVILAINEDIETLLREKRLRKDIYYRVRLIESFPSLKERLEQDLEHKYLRGLLATYRWEKAYVLRAVFSVLRVDYVAWSKHFSHIFTRGIIPISNSRMGR